MVTASTSLDQRVTSSWNYLAEIARHSGGSITDTPFSHTPDHVLVNGKLIRRSTRLQEISMRHEFTDSATDKKALGFVLHDEREEDGGVVLSESLQAVRHQSTDLPYHRGTSVTVFNTPRDGLALAVGFEAYPSKTDFLSKTVALSLAIYDFNRRPMSVDGVVMDGNIIHDGGYKTPAVRVIYEKPSGFFKGAWQARERIQIDDDDPANPLLLFRARGGGRLADHNGIGYNVHTNEQQGTIAVTLMIDGRSDKFILPSYLTSGDVREVRKVMDSPGRMLQMANTRLSPAMKGGEQRRLLTYN